MYGVIGKSFRQNICLQVSGMNRAQSSEIINEIKHGVYGANGNGETFAVCLRCLCSKVKIFVLDWR